MTALAVTMEDALVIRARELPTMIEDPTCNGTRQVLTRGYFRLLRRRRDRGVNFYATSSAS